VAWFERHGRNSALSQNTQLYNQVFNAVGAIRQALASVKE
jgi:hypothetical protein